MIEADRLSLAELAERSAVEPRTLRSWVQQGLVPGPDRRGRDARYPPGALTRALAVKALRDRYGLSLPAIRQELLLADPDRLRAWAAEAAPGAVPPAPAPAPPGTAAAYLAELRRAGLFGRRTAERSAASAAAGSASPRRPEPAGRARPPASGIDGLAALLEAAVDRPVPRRARAEVWLRIPLTADVELAVRGELSPDHIARLERIGDLVRALLTGGLEHD